MGFWYRFFAKLGEEESFVRVREIPDQRDSITARELGFALLRLARGSDETDAVVLRHFQDVPEIDLDQVRTELMCLRAFIVDFAACATLRDEAQRKTILDAFHIDTMGEITKQGPAGAAFVEHINNRIAAYTEAIREPAELGPAWPVGKAFAKFCGSEGSHEIALGSVEFSTSLEMIAGVLRKFRVVR